VRGLWRIERELMRQGFGVIAGVDEAGVGPLAGPVVAAAVVLPCPCRLPGLADSKLLDERRRERLYELIGRRALSVGIGVTDARAIDRVNIRQATHMAMREAVSRLSVVPALLIVDGRGWPGASLPQRAIVGGDRKCASIAAASIIAKVTRDRIMQELDARYPGYGFGRHKGYGTRYHLARIEELGPSPAHRLSYEPVRARLHARLPLEGA